MTAKSADSRHDITRDLVLANRILAHEGVLDAFGHVSVRKRGEPGAFLMSRSIAPANVTEQDVMTFNLEAEPLDQRGRQLYNERFIHSEIYKARADVSAVVHTHSPTLIPYSVSSTPLRPLAQVSGFLGVGAPIFDIRGVDHHGVDMLIRTPELGAALAHALGDQAVVLMRGHGSTTVGESLRQIVWRAIYAEINARQQIQAILLGDVHFLSPAEAMHAAKTHPVDPDRAWDLWVSKVS